jgi:hypothetical protein
MTWYLLPIQTDVFLVAFSKPEHNSGNKAYVLHEACEREDDDDDDDDDDDAITNREKEKKKKKKELE